MSHEHDHDHPHSHPPVHAPLPAPSREGSVVLEIGGHLGALIIHTGSQHDGLEIEVSPTNDSNHRTHAAVRPRRLPAQTTYCALISPLNAGQYTVWRTPQEPAGTVHVPAGAIGEFHWT